jgi:hypothetical protein
MLIPWGKAPIILEFRGPQGPHSVSEMHLSTSLVCYTGLPVVKSSDAAVKKDGF